MVVEKVISDWFSVYESWGHAILKDREVEATDKHNRVRQLTKELVVTRAQSPSAIMEKLEVWIQDNVDSVGHLRERPLSDLIVLSVVRDLMALQDTPVLRPHSHKIMSAMNHRLKEAENVICLSEHESPISESQFA